MISGKKHKITGVFIGQRLKRTRQYRIFRNDYLIFSGPGTCYTYNVGRQMIRRRIVVGSDIRLTLDITLTSLGFRGTEGTDWETLEYDFLAYPVVRIGVRDGKFVVDTLINEDPGFGGVQGTDWERLTDAGDGANIYREGLRDGKPVLDIALTPDAFNGVEGTDWETLEN